MAAMSVWISSPAAGRRLRERSSAAISSFVRLSWPAAGRRPRERSSAAISSFVRLPSPSRSKRRNSFWSCRSCSSRSRTHPPPTAGAGTRPLPALGPLPPPARSISLADFGCHLLAGKDEALQQLQEEQVA